MDREVIRAVIVQCLPKNAGSDGRRSKGDVWGGTTARGTVEKSVDFGVIENGVGRRNKPVENVLSSGVFSASGIPGVVVGIEVSQDKSLRREREKVWGEGVAP